MTFVRISGFKIYKDRLGVPRCYHRATNQKIDLVKFPIGTAGFIAECDRINRQSVASPASRPGTLGILIEKYRGHSDFLDLKPRTKADYQKCFDYLSKISDTPISSFNSPLVVGIRDEAAVALGRKWGTYVKSCLSLLFSWGLDKGLTVSNPARGVKSVKKPKNAPQANRPWTDAECHAAIAEDSGAFKVPLALMMFCALDPGDVMRLPKSAIKDGFLNTARQKTGVQVWVPLPQVVKEILETAPAHNAITVCASSDGTPWTKSGLDSAMLRLRTKLMAKNAIGLGLTMKGLRHTVATILAEMGYDERTIADMLGQKTIEMARHYSKRANKSIKMAGVIKSFDQELAKRRTKAE
jgi:integrase